MVQSLCLAWMECNRKCKQVNAVNAGGEVVAKLYLFFIYVRDEYEWWASDPGCFFSGIRLRYRLHSKFYSHIMYGGLEKETESCCYLESIHDLSVIQYVG